MELKLAKLPDRTPVKITITVKPALNAALQAYAKLYREIYGVSETVAELIPYMLQNFMDGDHGFGKAFKKGKIGDGEGGKSSSETRHRRMVTEPVSSS